MKRILLTAALFFSLSAMATQPGNNGGGNGGCGVGQQTNGCGSGTTPPGNGGQGGQGGAGGSAAAIAAAQARAEARATAVAAQSQTSRNTNTVRNNVTNTVTGGAVNVSVSLPAGATTDKAAGPQETVKETPAAAQKSDTLVVDNDNTRYPVSTAYAAPLTATNGTCMGSSSAGAQGAALGVSFGTTWTDTSCDIRYDAEALRAAGLPIAARARLCQKPEIAKAMEAAGTPCPGTDGKRAEAILNGQAGE